MRLADDRWMTSWLVQGKADIFRVSYVSHTFFFDALSCRIVVRSAKDENASSITLSG